MRILIMLLSVVGSMWIVHHYVMVLYTKFLSFTKSSVKHIEDYAKHKNDRIKTINSTKLDFVQYNKMALLYSAIFKSQNKIAVTFTAKYDTLAVALSKHVIHHHENPTSATQDELVAMHKSIDKLLTYSIPVINSIKRTKIRSVTSIDIILKVLETLETK